MNGKVSFMSWALNRFNIAGFHRLWRLTYSHHGAFGALAFGIEQVSGTCPRNSNSSATEAKDQKIEVLGSLPNKVGAKDIILAIIGKIELPGELAMY